MIIELNSKIPIYEQIILQIKKDIREGRLQENDALPSIRRLASDHKISALTVKKAYDALEREGVVVTVHGKGTFIAQINQQMVFEELSAQLEKDLETLLKKAKSLGLSQKDCQDLFHLLLEEIYAEPQNL